MWVDEDLTLEGLGTGVAPARTRRRPGARVGAAPAWVRDRLATTPGRLVLVSILVVVGAVLFGAIATGAEQSRERAAQAARSQTEPLLVHAKNLYTSLSDANATVATGLLSGGVETDANRSRYLADLRIATNALSGSPANRGRRQPRRSRLNTIADQLPLYSGLVETARANNRQGFPIGAAYLRQAVPLSTASMLPAADRIYRTEAQRLNDDYHTGAATATLVTFAVASAVALILLCSRSGTWRGSAGGFSTWGCWWRPSRWRRSRFGGSSHSSTSRTRSRPPRSTARIRSKCCPRQPFCCHAHRATSASRWSTAAPMRPTSSISPPWSARSRLSPANSRSWPVEPERPPPPTGSTSTTPPTRRRLTGSRTCRATATSRARSPSSPTTSASSDRLSSDLGGQVQAAQDRFSTAATDATSALGGLAFAIPVITVLAAVAALLGLRERINEYR